MTSWRPFENSNKNLEIPGYSYDVYRKT